MSGPKIFVSAGEVSGDQILAGILSHLRGRYPEMLLCGMGGSASEAWGLKPLFPMERTAFSGAWDVLRNLRFALSMYARAAAEMRRFQPDLVLLVDYPGLNLRLARLARSLGVPVLFVAPPQAWAYKKPARKLRRAREALQGAAVHVLFPFEKPWYQEAAASISVGHFLGAPVSRGPDAGLVLLCPGSRLPVLRRNLPIWLGLLHRTAAGSRYAVLVPPHLEEEAKGLVSAFAKAQVGPEALTVEVRTDKAVLLAEAAGAMAFPGTVTLELALARVPTLVLAIVDRLTLALGRRVLGHSRLALPNLILEEEFFPEWVGTAPGPSDTEFRALLGRRDGMDGWERRLEKLGRGMGEGDGAEVAFKGCVNLLEKVGRGK
jgi:lipid-A-disaccharide synthase